MESGCGGAVLCRGATPFDGGLALDALVGAGHRSSDDSKSRVGAVDDLCVAVLGVLSASYAVLGTCDRGAVRLVAFFKKD